MLFNKFTLMISSPWYTIRSANNALTAGGASSEYHQNNISILRMDQFPDLIREIEKIPYNQFFEIKADSLFKNNVINFWINNPIKTVKIWFNRLLFLWTIDPYHIKARNPIYMINILISVIFFLIGFYKLFKSIRSEIYSLENKKIFKILLLYSMILIYYSLIFLLTYNQIRYQVFLISILHPFFGFGFLTFTDFIKTIYKNKSITHYVKCSKFVILALIVLFITIYLSYLYYQKEKEYQSFIIFQKEAINGKVIKLNKNNELILLEVNNSPKKYCFHPGYTLDQIKYPFSKFVNIGDSIFKGAYADTLFIPNKRLKYNYIKMTKKLIQ
ncbi:MAG: hypothetical protein N2319_02835 [Candidatus Kapabacteria bacterium]|nr:hypothetical protein [Candidatus Kapabacteria bacterium]